MRRLGRFLPVVVSVLSVSLATSLMPARALAQSRISVEERLRAMEEKLQALQGENAELRKVNEALQERISSLEQQAKASTGQEYLFAGPGAPSGWTVLAQGREVPPPPSPEQMRKQDPVKEEGALMGGQVFFKGGYTHLDETRGGEIFVGGLLAPLERSHDAWQVGAGMDIPLLKDPWFRNTLLANMQMEFSRVTSKKTQFAARALVPLPLEEGQGKETFFNVSMAPKYRIERLGKVRPWIIPIGISFLVNSPPSESAAYLNVGFTTGLGVEYLLSRRFSIGVDFRYYFYDSATIGFNENHLTTGGYLGINF